jgi:hypothetical protein
MPVSMHVSTIGLFVVEECRTGAALVGKILYDAR